MTVCCEILNGRTACEVRERGELGKRGFPLMGGEVCFRGG